MPLMARFHRQLTWNSPLFYVALVAIGAFYGLALTLLPLLTGFLLVFFSILIVATLIEPLVGLVVTLFLALLRAWLHVELPEVPSLIAMPVLALTIGSWLMRGALRRDIRLRTPSLLYPLLLFVGAAVLSLWDGVELPVYGLPELLKWLQLLAVFWLVVDHVNARLLPWLVGALLLVGAFQASVGLWQFDLRGKGPDHFAIVTDRFYRAYGTFEQPNPFAGYVGLVFPLGLGILLNWGATKLAIAQLALRARAAPLTPRPWRSSRFPLFVVTGLALATGLTGAALVASWSRGAWFGMGVALLVIVAALPRHAWVGVGLVALLLLSTLGLGIVGMLPASVSARLTDFSQYAGIYDVRGVAVNDANHAVIERVAHWQAAVAMWRGNFWTGVGFGDYEPAYSDYGPLNWPIPLGHAHNYYLNIAAETGIVGLAAYLVLWAVVFWQTWRLTRRLSSPSWQRGLAVGLLGAWTHLSVHHLFDNLYVNNVHLHVGVMFGIVVLLAQAERQMTPPSLNTPGRIRPSAAPIHPRERLFLGLFE